jgi:hypothetical protein|tara:strand:- start:2715 stop:3203 length:489 start_codon:yes stop_codon:yes gene_type:complete
MAKLKGAKKAAFLKRMALGRRKAATGRTKTVKKTRTVKRKSITTKRKTTPLRRAAPRKRTMVKRRSSIRRVARRGSKGIGSSLKTGIIGDVVKGIGAGSLITLVMSRVAPGSSITPIASTGAAFLTGGIVGGAANLILTGGLGQLGGMFGGSASAPQQEFGV